MLLTGLEAEEEAEMPEGASGQPPRSDSDPWAAPPTDLLEKLDGP